MAYDTLKGLIRQYIKTNGQNEITGQILQNVLIAMVDEYPSLTGYATQQWVQSQGYLTDADLSNYATQTWVNTQLLGYLPTSTAIINNVVQSADGSVKLSGRNFADTYLDFTHTHRFEELTDLPTTLQDYGITDAYISNGVVYLGGVSVGSSTNPISNATRATSAGSASYADEAREADTLDGHHASDFLTSGALEGYATQSWVNTQLYGYLPLSAGSGNPLTGDLYMDDNYVRFESGTQAIEYSSRINSNELYVEKETAVTLGTDSVSVEGGKITVYSEYNDFDEGMVSNELIITATGIKVNNQPFATQSWVQSQGYITSAALTGYATQTWVGQYFVPISATYINEVTKSDDGTLKFAGSNFADTYLDFTHTHRFEELTDLPSTLQDYGITDAYISSGVVYLGGASVGSSTNPISNATRATSAGSASYADEAREADTLDGHHASDFLTSGALEGYATQSWVNTQLYGYLPLSAGSGNPLTGDLYMGEHYIRFESGTPHAIGYSSRINSSQFYIDKSTAATLGTDSVSVEGGKITVYSEYNDFDEGMVSNELVITATGIKVNNQPFATQNWVQSQGYATQSWVNTQLLGYLPTSTSLINAVVQSADGSLKVSGRNFADTYIDFTHTHRFEELTDLPTTLQDYGITDAYISSGVVYLGGASVGSSTNPISNATRATSAGSASYADEAREADTLDGHHASDFLTSGALEGYATQSWVNSNYLPTSALTGYATQSWVNTQLGSYLPTSTVLVNTLAKSVDGSVKFSGRNFADTYVDFTHDHRWEEIVDRPNIEIGGYGMTYTDGKFGVGIKVPSYPIDVDGSVRATSFVNSSDARLKNIEDYDADISTEAVSMAPAVHYRWKNRKDKTAMVGSIAQYWQNVLPEAVSTDDKGYLSMQYDVIALISAISIAKRTVEHERRIAELESENAQLRLELNSVKEVIKQHSIN